MMNLAEEFALIAYDDDGSAITDGTRVTHGLGGAIMLELALAGRIDVADKKVVVVDATPTGDALIDQGLATIAADAKPRKADHWVGKLAKNAKQLTMDRLVADGVLTVERDKVLWVFPRTRYPAAHGVEPPAETAARHRMRAAITANEEPDVRTASLCALMAATDLDKKIFKDLDRKQVKARLKEISEGAWAATAVKKSIEAIQAAMTVAIVAADSSGSGGDGGGGGGGGS